MRPDIAAKDEGPDVRDEWVEREQAKREEERGEERRDGDGDGRLWSVTLTACLSSEAVCLSLGRDEQTD